ncbi:MAG: T9SS type A sorting domain-containing protein [Bacteroidota bacterium]
MRTFLLLAALLCGHYGFSQQCDRPSASQIFQANNIRAVVRNNSTLIDGSVNGASFENSKFALGVSTLFASGIWFGATDAALNLLVSASTYSTDGRTDFVPGPYPEYGVPDLSICSNFDRFFSVTRAQIEAHLADYADNQTLDNPIDAILGWPAPGNPEFESIYGFALPTASGGLAPFHDRNNDGSYNPYDGDYPLPGSVDPDRLPEQMVWCIFNDSGSEESLGVEIHMTIWGFFCEENELLNNTIFTSHKVINRSVQNLNDMRMGLWQDFDLGCSSDDYVGCSPSQNSFYVYNGESEDQCSCGNTPAFCNGTPAMAITFLNQEMDSYINFYPATSNVNPGQQDPAAAFEFYNYLNGRWGDSQLLRVGGSGYQSGGQATKFAFPDLPTDVNGWSMLSAFLPPDDQRGVASMDLGTFIPGAIHTVDMAYSFHYDPSVDLSYEQVEPMLAEVSELQQLYDNAFDTGCTTVEACLDDCVWPGDANADGIANYQDLLEVGLAFGAQGPSRSTPPLWAPWSVDDWSDSFIDDTNFKHADCNGDGEVNAADFDSVTLFYLGETNDQYQEESICNEGSQMMIQSLLSRPIDTLVENNIEFLKVVLDYPDSLYGLAFEITYDTQYISMLTTRGAIDTWQGPNADNSIDFVQGSDENPLGNTLIYANVKTDGLTSPLRQGNLLFFNLETKDSISVDLPNITQLQFKNVRAILEDGTEVPFGGQTLDLVFEGLVITSTEEASAALPVRVWPNPATDLLQVELNGFAAEQLELLDTQGRILRSYAAQRQERMEVDLTGLPVGVYMVKVIGREQFGVYRVVKR